MTEGGACGDTKLKIMYKILFICTDNICRSMTAEYLLRDYLAKNKRENIAVLSAGIDAGSDISSYRMDHLDRLKEMGVDVSGHVRRQLMRELLADCDLAIVMDEDQRAWVRESFTVELPLYNEFYKGESVSLLVTPPGATAPIGERLVRMVDYIYESIPTVAARIDEYRTKK